MKHSELIEKRIGRRNFRETFIKLLDRFRPQECKTEVSALIQLNSKIKTQEFRIMQAHAALTKERARLVKLSNDYAKKHWKVSIGDVVLARFGGNLTLMKVEGITLRKGGGRPILSACKAIRGQGCKAERTTQITEWQAVDSKKVIRQKQVQHYARHLRKAPASSNVKGKRVRVCLSPASQESPTRQD